MSRLTPKLLFLATSNLVLLSCGNPQNEESIQNAGEYTQSGNNEGSWELVPIELRSEVPAGSAGATDYEATGGRLSLGAPQIFQGRIFPSQDTWGNPAIGFEVVDDQKEAFRQFTKDHLGKKTAFMRDGKVLVAPTLQIELNGMGVLEGNFTQEQIDQLLAGWPRSKH